MRKEFIMRLLYSCLIALSLTLGGLMLASSPAVADALDDARAAGQIGERPDGYVAVVDASAPASVKSLADSINRQRREAYQKIANEKGVPIEQIGALTAEKIIREKLSPGMFYMDASGAWIQK
jgi:uncharacterized protein YdbL (DUF1318 family)